MRRNLWKGVAISGAAYSAAVISALGIDFRIALFLLLGLQVTWTLFCVVRVIQLAIAGAHRRDADPLERDSYGLALGGSVSSVALLAVIVVWTQVV